MAEYDGNLVLAFVHYYNDADADFVGDDDENVDNDNASRWWGESFDHGKFARAADAGYDIGFAAESWSKNNLVGEFQIDQEVCLVHVEAETDSEAGVGAGAIEIDIEIDGTVVEVCFEAFWDADFYWMIDFAVEMGVEADFGARIQIEFEFGVEIDVV